MGLPTVEHFFYSFITDYLGFLKENLYFVDYVLATKDLRLKDYARKLVQKTPIQVFLMFPRQIPKAPFVTITIASETSAVSYIGDSLTVPFPVAEATTTGEVLTFQDGEARLKNFPVKTLTLYEDGVVVPSEAYLIDYFTGLIHLGERYRAWATYTATYTYFTAYLEELSYLNSYHVVFDVLSTNVDEVVILHRLLHHLILSERLLLSALGMKNQSVSCGEVTPQFSGDQPEPLYGRTLTLSFDMEVSGFLPYSVIRNIYVSHS